MSGCPEDCPPTDCMLSEVSDEYLPEDELAAGEWPDEDNPLEAGTPLTEEDED